MPGAGGLEVDPADPRGRAAAREVLIVSSLAEEGAEETVAALALGAADTLPKPGTGRFNGRFSEILLGKLRALGHAEPQAPLPPPRPRRARHRAPLRAMPTEPLRLLAIGASTGGIHALGAFFQALPTRIGVPILVTQHLPAPFMTVFARQLRHRRRARGGRRRGRHAAAARPDRHRSGRRPPDGRRGRRQAGRAAAPRPASSSGCLPSVDPMLASAGADAWRRGARRRPDRHGPRRRSKAPGRLVAAGGSVIAQDEASSAVWGMPRAVAEAGLACAVLPPDKLARRVAAPARERARASKRQLQPHSRRPARGAHRPATDDEPPLADRDRACRRCCASAASPTLDELITILVMGREPSAGDPGRRGAAQQRDLFLPRPHAVRPAGQRRRCPTLAKRARRHEAAAHLVGRLLDRPGSLFAGDAVRRGPGAAGPAGRSTSSAPTSSSAVIDRARERHLQPVRGPARASASPR